MKKYIKNSKLNVCFASFFLITYNVLFLCILNEKHALKGSMLQFFFPFLKSAINISFTLVTGDDG